jgi:hypothetical protein
MCACVQVCAQGAKVDSLRQALRGQPHDSAWARTLYRLAHRLQFSEEEEALRLTNQGIQISDSLDLRTLNSDFHCLRAEILGAIGIFDEALKSALYAYEGFVRLNDTGGMANALNNVGMINGEMKEWDHSGLPSK